MNQVPVMCFPNVYHTTENYCQLLQRNIKWYYYYCFRPSNLPINLPFSPYYTSQLDGLFYDGYLIRMGKNLVVHNFLNNLHLPMLSPPAMSHEQIKADIMSKYPENSGNYPPQSNDSTGSNTNTYQEWDDYRKKVAIQDKRLHFELKSTGQHQKNNTQYQEQSTSNASAAQNVPTVENQTMMTPIPTERNLGARSGNLIPNQQPTPNQRNFLEIPVDSTKHQINNYHETSKFHTNMKNPQNTNKGCQRKPSLKQKPDGKTVRTNLKNAATRINYQETSFCNNVSTIISDHNKRQNVSAQSSSSNRHSFTKSYADVAQNKSNYGTTNVSSANQLEISNTTKSANINRDKTIHKSVQEQCRANHLKGPDDFAMTKTKNAAVAHISKTLEKRQLNRDITQEDTAQNINVPDTNNQEKYRTRSAHHSENNVSVKNLVRNFSQENILHNASEKKTSLSSEDMYKKLEKVLSENSNKNLKSQDGILETKFVDLNREKKQYQLKQGDFTSCVQLATTKDPNTLEEKTIKTNTKATQDFEEREKNEYNNFQIIIPVVQSKLERISFEALKINKLLEIGKIDTTNIKAKIMEIAKESDSAKRILRCVNTKHNSNPKKEVLEEKRSHYVKQEVAQDKNIGPGLYSKNTTVTREEQRENPVELKHNQPRVIPDRIAPHNQSRTYEEILQKARTKMPTQLELEKNAENVRSTEISTAQTQAQGRIYQNNDHIQSTNEAKSNKELKNPETLIPNIATDAPKAKGNKTPETLVPNIANDALRAQGILEEQGSRSEQREQNAPGAQYFLEQKIPDTDKSKQGMKSNKKVDDLCFSRDTIPQFNRKEEKLSNADNHFDNKMEKNPSNEDQQSLKRDNIVYGLSSGLLKEYPLKIQSEVSKDGGHVELKMADDIKIQKAFKQIQILHDEAEELLKQVNTFEGTSEDKKFIYLDEMITRVLLNLDNVETENNKEVRLKRKNCSKFTKNALNTLKIKAGEL